MSQVPALDPHFDNDRLDEPQHQHRAAARLVGGQQADTPQVGIGEAFHRRIPEQEAKRQQRLVVGPGMGLIGIARPRQGDEIVRRRQSAPASSAASAPAGVPPPCRFREGASISAASAARYRIIVSSHDRPAFLLCFLRLRLSHAARVRSMTASRRSRSRCFRSRCHRCGFAALRHRLRTGRLRSRAASFCDERCTAVADSSLSSV